MRRSILSLALGVVVLVAAPGAGGQGAKNTQGSSKLKITTVSLPNGEAGAAYSATVTATGGVAPFTFSAAGLPTGLSIDAASGKVTGSPAASAVGTASVVVTVTDSTTPNALKATANFRFQVNAALAISTTLLPAATAGQAYSATVTATGGVRPLSFSATGLPSGLGIEKNSGRISGTPQPSSVGTAAVAVRVTDSNPGSGKTAMASLSLTVNAARLKIGTHSLPPAEGGAPYAATVAATGGVAPYAFSATGLPTGLSIDPASGKISGSPASNAGGQAQVSVTVTDASPAAQTATSQLGLTVDAALSLTGTALPDATVGARYGAWIAATGGIAPYTYTATGLPAGLSIDKASGRIAGTPPPGAAGADSFSVTVADSNPGAAKTATAQFTIYVRASVLKLTAGPLPAAEVGASFSAAVAASGGTPPYTFSATGLPTGLSIDPASGKISGTPAAGTAGTVPVGLKVTDSGTPTAGTATGTAWLTVAPALAISTTTLPSATIGVDYQASVTATGGTQPYYFYATGLPAGLSIDRNSGRIYGKPQASATGTATVSVWVTDSNPGNAQTVTTSLSLTVAVAKLRIFSQQPLPQAEDGAAYSAIVQVSGGQAPYTFAARGLPAGLTLDPKTGAITGTVAATTVGTAKVNVTVTDSGTPTAQTANCNLMLTIDAAVAIVTTSLPNGKVGERYMARLQESGGVPPYTYDATGLPAGLTIDRLFGTISGKPAPGAEGTTSVTITVTDSLAPTAQTASATLNLTIAGNPVTIATTALPAGTVGQSYDARLLASGGAPPLSYAAKGLPDGLSLQASTGRITGIPKQDAVGTASVTFTVTDSSRPTAQTATAILSLAIASTKLTITTGALPDAKIGAAYNATVAVTGGVTPYAFTATGLPAGLQIDPVLGKITGTPTQTTPGTAQVQVTVTDTGTPTPQTATAQFTLAVDPSSANEACGGLSLGTNASLNGFVPFPASSPWNTDISTAPLDPNNTAITTAAGFAGSHLHPDFSSTGNGNYGIPYVVVDSSTTPLVSIDVLDYASQSDVAQAPFPANAPIEDWPTPCTGWPDTYVGDAHVLVLDRNTCFLYETFNTHTCGGAWKASSETIWDMRAVEQRPWGWTSADAAGLPIFPGLVRYDEVAAGAINHALRFTLEHTKNDASDGYFVEPATHAAGTSWGASNVMGMRIRLKAGFDISQFSKTNQIILTAMQKYGMILADNGGDFFFQGAPDPRWDDDDLNNLKSVPSSAFEVVQMTPAFPGWDANTAPTGAAPVISSFTASQSPVPAGTPVTLTWAVTGDSYDYIDLVGGVRDGSVTVTPTATTTYTLNSVNQYGKSQEQVTVTVQ